MKVKELIEKLKEFNEEAETCVVVHNKREEYTISWETGGEGGTKNDALRVCFYVDSHCVTDTKRGIKMKTVIISLRGGIAEVAEASKGIKIIINDYDVQNDEGVEVSEYIY